MSYSLHASGTGGFRRSRTSLTEDDIFGGPDEMRGYVRRALGVDPRGSMTERATRMTMTAYGRISAMHTLTQQITLLMAEASPDSWIGLGAESAGYLTPSTAFQRISLSGEDVEPIIAAMTHTLRRGEMNYWSVLLEIGAVISEYSSHVGNGVGTRMLLISVWR